RGEHIELFHAQLFALVLEHRYLFAQFFHTVVGQLSALGETYRRKALPELIGGVPLLSAHEHGYARRAYVYYCIHPFFPPRNFHEKSLPGKSCPRDDKTKKSKLYLRRQPQRGPREKFVNDFPQRDNVLRRYIPQLSKLRRCEQDAEREENPREFTLRK